MAFGERLQEVRRQAGLTQEQFAEELNVSRQAVSRWESCRGYPEMEKLLYLCNRYGVTLNELFSEEVPLGEADSPAPKETPRMEEPSLRKEFRNFISNLSLRGQLSGLAVVLFTALLIVLCARGLQGGSEAMDNVMTLVWTGAVILFGIAEGLTAGLVSIWFVFGSLAALAAAFLNASLGVQVALFVLVSAVTLALTRPMVRRLMRRRSEPTNLDRVVGETGRVTETIDNAVPSGAVYVGGKTWTARSEGEEIIPAGSQVTVVRIEGVKLLVKNEKKVEVTKE